MVSEHRPAAAASSSEKKPHAEEKLQVLNAPQEVGSFSSAAQSQPSPSAPATPFSLGLKPRFATRRTLSNEQFEGFLSGQAVMSRTFGTIFFKGVHRQSFRIVRSELRMLGVPMDAVKDVSFPKTSVLAMIVVREKVAEVRFAMLKNPKFMEIEYNPMVQIDFDVEMTEDGKPKPTCAEA